jgi:hypothetical protein
MANLSCHLEFCIDDCIKYLFATIEHIGVRFKQKFLGIIGMSNMADMTAILNFIVDDDFRPCLGSVINLSRDIPHLSNPTWLPMAAMYDCHGVHFSPR